MAQHEPRRLDSVRVHPEPYYDEAGRFIHKCWCGKDGSFGFGCFPREGKLGKYYCLQHRPIQAQEPGKLPRDVASSPSGIALRIVADAGDAR
jgi:hypothetical protein